MKTLWLQDDVLYQWSQFKGKDIHVFETKIFDI